MKKYLVFPRSLMSEDGDIHYINAHQLICLYGVNPSECHVIHDRKDIIGLEGTFSIFEPSYGDYTIPPPVVVNTTMLRRYV